MGKPRSGARKKPIVLSDDDDEEETAPSTTQKASQIGSRSGSFQRPDDGSASQDLQKKTKKRSVPLKQCQNASFIGDSQQVLDTSQSKDRIASRKAQSKNLYSFFNPATQLQLSQGSQNPDKIDVREKEEDLIDDDFPDEELLQRFAKPKDLPLLGKRVSRGLEVNDDDPERLPSGSQKFLKSSSGARVQFAQENNVKQAKESGGPWTERFAPLNLDELAVHKRKVTDVEVWLRNVLEGRSPKRLLVLKGGAGTGKTTTVKLLSQNLGFQIREWKNPDSNSSADGFVPVWSLFEDFIGRTTTYGTLDFNRGGINHSISTPVQPDKAVPGKSIILAEEFPIVLAGSPINLQLFRSTIQRYLAANSHSTGASRPDQDVYMQSTTPLVMIISETLLSAPTASVDNFTAHRLLGPDILHHPATTLIEFNPIAPTILSKALDLIIVKEARQSGRSKVPGPQVVKRLSEIGDVRSAVSALEFLCVRGDECDDWGTKVAFSKTKRRPKDLALTRMEADSLEAVNQRADSLGIFHAVGKVVYNRREAASASEEPLPQPPTFFPQHRRSSVHEVRIDKLNDELGTDTYTFVAAVHENYILSCEGSTAEDTIDSINGCIDALSDADLISSDYYSRTRSRSAFQRNSGDALRQDELSFHVSVRGVLFSLPSPVKRSAVPPGLNGGYERASKMDAFKMFYPTSARLWRKQQELGGMLDSWVARAKSMDFTVSTQKQEPGPGSVESWSRYTQGNLGTTSAASTASDSESTGVPRPLIGGGSSARREMLLERLPYVAIVARKKSDRYSATDVRELEKITSFTGIGGQSDEIPDDLDSEQVLELDGKAKSSERLPPMKGSQGLEGIHADRDGLSGPGGLQRLVLSDDDIEDD